MGSNGSKWTDVALSTSSTLPDFPDPLGPGTPNEPVFEFKFKVLGGDITTGQTLFFNVLFGDYDVAAPGPPVVPAKIALTFATGPTQILPLSLQPGASDGLIQASFTNLNFFDVFTADGLTGDWIGYLKVAFDADVEPYTAFDFTELSLVPIATSAVPEPGSVLLVATGALALVARGIRRRRAARV